MELMVHQYYSIVIAAGLMRKDIVDDVFPPEVNGETVLSSYRQMYQNRGKFGLEFDDVRMDDGLFDKYSLILQGKMVEPEPVGMAVSYHPNRQRRILLVAYGMSLAVDVASDFLYATRQELREGPRHDWLQQLCENFVGRRVLRGSGFRHEGDIQHVLLQALSE